MVTDRHYGQKWYTRHHYKLCLGVTVVFRKPTCEKTFVADRFHYCKSVIKYYKELKNETQFRNHLCEKVTKTHCTSLRELELKIPELK